MALARRRVPARMSVAQVERWSPGAGRIGSRAPDRRELSKGRIALSGKSCSLASAASMAYHIRHWSSPSPFGGITEEARRSA